MNVKRGARLLRLLLLLAMVLIPLLAFGGQAKLSANGTKTPAVQRLTKSGKQFRILDTSSGKVLNVNDGDFLTATVATEMSPDAPSEALKAQAVAAYTYYSRLRKLASGKGNSDFSADTANATVYMTDEQMKKRWGSSYSKYYAAVSSAADAVFGQTLTYGGELADTTYFAISSGCTENSEDVWGGKYPYLISVASPNDMFASGYLTSASFAENDFRSRILSVAPKAKLEGDAGSWIGTVSRSQAGTVKTAVIGGETLTGGKIRQAFGLRSANFTVSHESGKFLFMVHGYGHDVGMSQTGAEAMAREGASYKEILTWYYPGTVLTAKAV
jgi:stage II sporulation protein D